ncbi:MAG: ABC transporter permease subunit [Lachnospiraceae bacterium]|nr:ABC transporter permease subunit [Lachnospiraceae bacterium]
MNSTVSSPEFHLRYSRKGKLRVDCAQKERTIPVFLTIIAILAVGSFFFLDISWGKLLSRLPGIGTIFWKMMHFDISNMNLVMTSMMETLSITVLSTLYSLVLGLFFGMLAAENIFRLRWFSRLIQCIFTFLRAVPTTIWVLLMMVCLGMGPAAGIAGLCVHTTAFFTKSFAQSFESIPAETLEALEATGVGRLGVFLNAVLPSSLSQIIAWTGMRFETNFCECAVLGMVGAGGIGFVISNSIQGYDYGTAGIAILLVFLFAYSIERIFVWIKKCIR